VVTGSKQKKCR